MRRLAFAGLLLVSACRRVEVPEAVRGEWRVASWAYPGAAMLVQAEVMSWLTARPRFEAREASFGANRCGAPSYASRGASATVSERAGYMVLRPQARLVDVVEVRCGGAPWADPGRTLLVLDDGSVVSGWAGRYFLLERAR